MVELSTHSGLGRAKVIFILSFKAVFFWLCVHILRPPCLSSIHHSVQVLLINVFSRNALSRNLIVSRVCVYTFLLMCAPHGGQKTTSDVGPCLLSFWRQNHFIVPPSWLACVPLEIVLPLSPISP